MLSHDEYMRRCFDLARKAGSATKTNPKVGAVLVYKDRIIGEGYHSEFGKAHAEVEALTSVSKSDKPLIPKSTLYVSLEPCCITRKTPPCVNLILEKEIKKVVVSVKDPNPDVAGRSIQMMKEHGVELVEDVLSEEGQNLIAPFIAHLDKRPYIILKFAQSRAGYMGMKEKQIWLSNRFAKMKSHKWRTELDAILIGYRTAILDNPQLNAREYNGTDPLRIVLDKEGSLPRELNLWQDNRKTLFVSQVNRSDVLPEGKTWLQLDFDESLLSKLMTHLFEMGILHLMVEGGAKTLKHFINSEIWDEVRIIKTDHLLNSGIRAPQISKRPFFTEKLLNNQIEYLFNR